MDDWNAQGWLYFDTVLWLSYLCNTKELKLLLAFFWVSNSLVRIVSLFIVQGILGLRGTNDHAGWQYVFLQKGLLTFVIGVFSILNISVGPTQTQNWFYKNVWFTEREEYIIVNRIVRDNPSKSNMQNRQRIDLAGFKKTLWDNDLWPFYLLGLAFLIFSYPLHQYLTLQLKHFGFSTTLTNALSILVPALGLVLLVLMTLLTEVVNNKSFVRMLENMWSSLCFLALYFLPESSGPWTFWTMATIQQAAPSVHPI